MIMDAKTMTPQAYALASDMRLFGFHVRFYPLDTQQKKYVQQVNLKDEL
jgi:hypothetical protein